MQRLAKLQGDREAAGRPAGRGGKDAVGELRILRARRTLQTRAPDETESILPWTRARWERRYRGVWWGGWCRGSCNGDGTRRVVPWGGTYRGGMRYRGGWYHGDGAVAAPWCWVKSQRPPPKVRSEEARAPSCGRCPLTQMRFTFKT